MSFGLADLFNDLKDVAVGAVQPSAVVVGGLIGDLEGALRKEGLDNPLDPTFTDSDTAQSKYDFRSRTFPLDLGESSYNGHYMVINVNVSNFTNYGQVSQLQALGLNFTKLKDLSTVDALRSTIDKAYRSADNKNLGVGIYAPRQTRRIVESIALFMPNTVTFSSLNEYSDVSLTEIAERAGSSLVSALPFGGSINKLAGTAGSLLATGFQLAHQPINPRVELMFSSTALRQFQYDFLFAPASKKESEAIETIIRTLRFHAAPEYNGINVGGKSIVNETINALTSLKALLWVSPSEFDITFFHQGKENTHIPRINTCVLEQVDVDYAPTGIYSTFSNGHPVSIRMQLRFREVEVNHKLRIGQGY